MGREELRSASLSSVPLTEIRNVERPLAPPDSFRINDRQLGPKHLFPLCMSAQVRGDDTLGVCKQGMSVGQRLGVCDVDGRAEETLAVESFQEFLWVSAGRSRYSVPEEMSVPRPTLRKRASGLSRAVGVSYRCRCQSH